MPSLYRLAATTNPTYLGRNLQIRLYIFKGLQSTVSSLLKLSSPLMVVTCPSSTDRSISSSGWEGCSAPAKCPALWLNLCLNLPGLLPHDSVHASTYQVSCLMSHDSTHVSSNKALALYFTRLLHVSLGNLCLCQAPSS